MDTVERVMRAIQDVRERNGGPPYDAFDAIYGERSGRKMREELREEAKAAMAAAQIKD